MIYLIFAEAALEVIPKVLWNKPKIKEYANKKGKPPSSILLDASNLYYVMKELNDFNKRGRPDIIHFSLLYALGSELNIRGKLKVYVHTLNDQIICLDSKVRLPRNYTRFTGLMEQLFERKVITDQDGNKLLSISSMKLNKLLAGLGLEQVIILQEGKPILPTSLIDDKIRREEDLAFIIGAFPHGNYRQETLELSSLRYSLSEYLLDTWNVTGKLLAICELLMLTGNTKLT